MPQLANKVHSIHWAGGDQEHACIVLHSTRASSVGTVLYEYSSMGSTLPKGVVQSWKNNFRRMIPHADYSKIVKPSFETRMQPEESISRSNNFGDLLQLGRRKKRRNGRKKRKKRKT